MGVNATGTLRGVAGRAPKTRESRRRRRRGEWGLGRGVPLPRKFMNFSSQNCVIWCILGVLFLRFASAVFRSSAEAKKNKTLVKILGGRQRRTTPAGQMLGVATPATAAEAWIVSRGRITSAGKNRHRPSSIRACPSNDCRLHLLIDSSVASTAARLTAAKTPQYLNKLLQKW